MKGNTTVNAKDKIKQFCQEFFISSAAFNHSSILTLSNDIIND